MAHSTRFESCDLCLRRTRLITSQTATISECRYRWLRLPATTCVITHSPSRFNRRDGLNSTGVQRTMEPIRTLGKWPGPSRMTGGHRLSTKHRETLFVCRLQVRAGNRSLSKRKSFHSAFTIKGRLGVRIYSSAPLPYRTANPSAIYVCPNRDTVPEALPPTRKIVRASYVRAGGRQIARVDHRIRCGCRLRTHPRRRFGCLAQ
jgi:hypothetical protein